MITGLLLIFGIPAALALSVEYAWMPVVHYLEKRASNRDASHEASPHRALPRTTPHR